MVPASTSAIVAARPPSSEVAPHRPDNRATSRMLQAWQRVDMSLNGDLFNENSQNSNTSPTTDITYNTLPRPLLLLRLLGLISIPPSDDAKLHLWDLVQFTVLHGCREPGTEQLERMVGGELCSRRGGAGGRAVSRQGWEPRGTLSWSSWERLRGGESERRW